MAFTQDDILEALQQAGVDAGKTRQVLENLKQVEEEKKEEKEANKEPKQKNQFVVFVMDDGTLAGKDLIGYVVQIPADKAPQSAYDLFVDSVRGYNNGARKAKKHPVEEVGDGMQTVKGKWLKDAKLKIKTKEAVLVLPVKNKIDNPKKEVVAND
jgi:hypothetical protein